MPSISPAPLPAGALLVNAEANLTHFAAVSPK
jgi:hypothetical protein